MSFNQPHINITRANYEEAFLLYIDGELNEESMSAVEAFVSLHPDLQEELNILLSTKLNSEVFVLDNKESLFAENMKSGVTDEDLLLYIDDELPATQKHGVEKKLAADPNYKYQHQQLMSTRLIADGSIVYPKKSELYRRTQKRIQPKLWMRIAAAIVILLSIGILSTSIKGGKDETVPDIVQVPHKKQPTTNVEKAQPLETPTADIALQAPAQTSPEKSKMSIRNEQAVTPSSLPAPDRRNRVIALHKPATSDVTIQKTDATEKAIVQQQTINKPSVTTNTEPAYTTIDEDATTATGFSHAVAISNDGKKGSVRGFLRKASRFIERRTGINPVNEDDELLIGVVALKLK